jgi:ATP/maltotriose-dependent transcriptional regulator MalT
VSHFFSTLNRTNFEQKLNEIMQTVQIKGVVEVVREMLAEEAEKRIKKAEARRKKAEENALKEKENALKEKENARKAQIEHEAKTEFAVVQFLNQGIDNVLIANAFNLPLQTILAIQEKHLKTI